MNDIEKAAVLKSFIERSVDNLSENLQDDLICLLDDYSDELVDKVCDIVVSRIHEFRQILKGLL